MSENYTEAMCYLVEQYIHQRTGKRIKIIFNNPQKMRVHLTMLREAYNHVQQLTKK
jgi:hypothetical protein